MDKIKISIIGNSVALRKRPPEKFPNNLNYGELLEKALCNQYPNTLINVTNLAFSSATILDTLDQKDRLISSFPNFFIINLGCCDAASKAVPYWMYNRIKETGKRTLLNRFLVEIYNRIIRPYRRFFVYLLGCRSRIPLTLFQKKFDQLLALLKKETNAQIIVLSINPCNERVERVGPKTQVYYRLFNDVMKEKAQKYNSLFLNLSDLQSRCHHPDGIHFSAEGHKLVAERLLELVSPNCHHQKKIC